MTQDLGYHGVRGDVRLSSPLALILMGNWRRRHDSEFKARYAAVANSCARVRSGRN